MSALLFFSTTINAKTEKSRGEVFCAATTFSRAARPRLVLYPCPRHRFHVVQRFSDWLLTKGLPVGAGRQPSLFPIVGMVSPMNCFIVAIVSLWE